METIASTLHAHKMGPRWLGRRKVNALCVWAATTNCTGVFKDNRCEDLQARNCSFRQGIRCRSRSRTQSIVLELTQLLEAAVKENTEKGINSEHCKGEELPLRAVVSALTAAPFQGARGPGEARQCLRNRSGLGAKLWCAENAITLNSYPQVTRGDLHMKHRAF